MSNEWSETRIHYVNDNKNKKENKRRFKKITEKKMRKKKRENNNKKKDIERRAKGGRAWWITKWGRGERWGKIKGEKWENGKNGRHSKLTISFWLILYFFFFFFRWVLPTLPSGFQITVSTRSSSGPWEALLTSTRSNFKSVSVLVGQRSPPLRKLLNHMPG